MKKVLALFTAAAVIAIGMVACNNKNSRLYQIAEEANKQCPLSMGTIGEISSIEFDGTDMVYNALVWDDYLDVIEQNKELSKQGGLQALVSDNENVDELLKELEAANAGLKYVLKGKKSGREFSFHLSPEEIKQAKANPVDPEIFLDQQVEAVNMECPMEVGEGMVMSRVYIADANVVYVYEVDENILSMDEMEANSDELQASLDQYLSIMWSDPSGKAFLQACKNAGKNIAYSYQGQQTGKTLEFVCTL